MGDFFGGSPWFTLQTWILEATGIALLVAAGWMPRFFGTAFILFQLTCTLLPSPWGINASALCVYAIIGYLIFIHSYALAIVSAVSIIIVNVIGADSGINIVQSTIFEVLTFLLTGIVAWLLDLRNKSVLEARAELAAARKENESTLAALREDLADALHDQSVAELSHVVMLCDSVCNASVSSDAQSQILKIQEESRNALKHLRAMISTLQNGAVEVVDNVGFPQLIERYVDLAGGCGIDLAIDLPSRIHSRLNPIDSVLLRLVLAELTTNLVKYGKRNSTANLIVNNDGNTLVVTATNRITSDLRQEEDMHSKHGLNHLTAVLKSRGGTLEYATQGDLWLTLVTIPNANVEPHPDIIDKTESAQEGTQS